MFKGMHILYIPSSKLEGAYQHTATHYSWTGYVLHSLEVSLTNAM